MRYFTRKIKVKNGLLTILIDSREKQPWKFPEYKTEVTCLKTGDYSFKGLEKYIAIERKSSISELLTDVSGKNKKWFKGVLLRLGQYKIKCIIVEDTFDNLDKYLAYTSLTADNFYYWIWYITISQRIPILFVGKTLRKDKVKLQSFFMSLLDLCKENL